MLPWLSELWFSSTKYSIWCGWNLEQVKMAGELSYRTTLEAEVEVAVEGAVDVLVLI